jgi:hypothetical protein
MATSVYPTGVIQWTPRINCVDIVWANDPNSLANELVAIETTVGINPQIEKSPPTSAAGPTVAYNTVDKRISDAMNNNLLPYTYLKGVDFWIPDGAQHFNVYTPTLDPYNMYNGQDITIPCDGYWSVFGNQRWNQQGDSFVGLNMNFLYINGDWRHVDYWNWSDVIGDDPFSFYTFPSNVMQSNGYTNLAWEGLLHAGDRIQVLSANVTFCPAILVNNIELKMSCIRTFPSSTTFPSG